MLILTFGLTGDVWPDVTHGMPGVVPLQEKVTFALGLEDRCLFGSQEKKVRIAFQVPNSFEVPKTRNAQQGLLWVVLLSIFYFASFLELFRKQSTINQSLTSLESGCLANGLCDGNPSQLMDDRPTFALPFGARS